MGNAWCVCNQFIVWCRLHLSSFTVLHVISRCIDIVKRRAIGIHWSNDTINLLIISLFLQTHTLKLHMRHFNKTLSLRMKNITKATYISIVTVPWLKVSCRFRPLDSSTPGQKGRHFTDNMFRCIFMNEMFSTIEMSQKCVPKDPIDRPAFGYYVY